MDNAYELRIRVTKQDDGYIVTVVTTGTVKPDRQFFERRKAYTEVRAWGEAKAMIERYIEYCAEGEV